MTELIKYPRTPHLPWSSGTDDDKMLKSVEHFVGCEVVVTEKMDGECTTMSHGYCYARSPSGGHHEWQTWVRGLHAAIQSDIPKGWRICGENMYAEHSIHYTNLPSYFLVFSIWDDRDCCQSWATTLVNCDELGLSTVPIIWQGLWNETKIKVLAQTAISQGKEGIIVRCAGPFTHANFGTNVAKWVRPNHVTTDEHWMNKPISKNELREQICGH